MEREDAVAIADALEAYIRAVIADEQPRADVSEALACMGAKGDLIKALIDAKSS